jgi:hypothetical protein
MGSVESVESAGDRERSMLMKASNLLVSVFLASIVTDATAGDEVVQVKPPVLPEAIASFVRTRGLSIPTSISNYCGFDFKKSGSPFFISGDFDDDGKRDYAIKVEDKKHGANLFVFLDNGQIHELQGWEYIFTNKTRGKTGTIDGTIRLTYDSIGGVACEQSSVLYVYSKSKKRFVQYFTGD